MKKNIIFFGDSITDCSRDRNSPFTYSSSMGTGYAYMSAVHIHTNYPSEYNVINRGIGGNRIVDLYARVKSDVWNLEPDVLSILIGINDVWHEVAQKNGVELDRFINVYKLILKETKERFPNVKLIIMEPFVIKGPATEENFDKFLTIKDYAREIKKLAEEFGATFIPLQDKIDELLKTHDPYYVLADGVHPNFVGAGLLAREWITAFEKIKNN